MTLPNSDSLANVGQRWTAVYCKPRQEKALARDLCRKEVPYFFPMLYRETFSGGRRRRNLTPMFRSYLFFAGDAQHRLAVLKTGRVATFVEIDDAQQHSFRKEIFSLELALRTSPESIELYPRLVEGAWVRVTCGAMKGVEGTIVDADKIRRPGDSAKLVLSVATMGSGAQVTIHPDRVEPYARDGREAPAATVTVEYDLEHRAHPVRHNRPCRTE